VLSIECGARPRSSVTVFVSEETAAKGRMK
jgi:hypothetical protein